MGSSRERIRSDVQTTAPRSHSVPVRKWQHQFSSQVFLCLKTFERARHASTNHSYTIIEQGIQFPRSIPNFNNQSNNSDCKFQHTSTSHRSIPFSGPMTRQPKRSSISVVYATTTGTIMKIISIKYIPFVLYTFIYHIYVIYVDI